MRIVKVHPLVEPYKSYFGETTFLREDKAVSGDGVFWKILRDENGEPIVGADRIGDDDQSASIAVSPLPAEGAPPGEDVES